MTLLNNRVVYLLLALFVPMLALAQVQEVPVHFGQYFNNPQINPAQIGADGDLELSLGSQQNAGIFNGVSTSFATLGVRIKGKGENFHVVGGHFNRDAEGEILRRNRIYLSYSHHFKLSTKNKFALGMGLGSYQFGIKSNPVTGGVSEGVLDASAGVYIYSNRGYLGLALRQFRRAELRPLEQLIILEPRYDLLAKREFIMSEAFSISGLTYMSYSDQERKEDRLRGGLTGLFLMSRLLEFGASYEINEGVHTIIGLRDIHLKESGEQDDAGRLSFALSYFIPQLDNTRTNINSFEFTLGYTLSK